MIGLVACCKTKLAEPARAEDLYRSPLFRKARAYCLAHYPRWFILSAKYGLVDPGQVIAPYDCTLLDQGKPARAKWGQLVYRQLVALDLAGESFTAYAGKVYVSPLADKLRLETPLAGLGIGQQLAWYGTHGIRTEYRSHRAKNNELRQLSGTALEVDSTKGEDNADRKAGPRRRS